MNSSSSSRDDVPATSKTAPLHVSRLQTERSKPTVSDHELLRPIGSGSYGEVWLARNVMGAYRAIKVVYRDTFDTDTPFEREFSGIKKFEPVSRAHHSQVAVLHVGRDDKAGYFYYVMELADDAVAGGAPAADSEIDTANYVPQTLRSLTKDRKRLAPEECIDLALGLTTALEHLHAHGLVHRDIKPSNIIVVNGRPKLADIGLVAQSNATLSFVGTEGFVPPEGPGQPRADLFSLGKTLYEIATGKDRVQFPEPPTSLAEDGDSGLFMEFNEILLKACAYDAGQRYGSAKEMHQELLLLKAGKSVRRARIVESRLTLLKKIAVAFLATSLLASAAYIYQQHQTREARRLATENQNFAAREAKQRQKAESALQLRERQAIERMLESGQSSRALTLLARQLRQNPNDTLAAQRLTALLLYRDFALPLAELRHDSVILDAEITPDGQFLVSLAADGKATLWNLRRGERLNQAEAGTYRLENYVPNNYIIPPANIDVSPTGTRVVAPGGSAHAARVWTLTNGFALALEIPLPDGQSEMAHAVFSPDGRDILAVSTTGDAFVFDAQTGEQLTSMRPNERHLATIVDGAFTPNGELVITTHGPLGGRQQRTLHVWDRVTGQHFAQLSDPGLVKGMQRQWRATFALSPTHPYLAYIRGGIPSYAKLWDYRADHIFTAPESHEWPIGTVAFSPDGRRFASGSNDQTIRLWDVRNGLRIRHILRQPGKVTTVAFSPNGERVASGSENGIFQIWDVSTGEVVGELNQHPGPVRHLAFTPDGKRLVSFTDDSAWVWDVRPGSALPTPLVHNANGDIPGAVASLRFSPDGTRLISSLSLSVRDERGGPHVSTEGALNPKTYSMIWDTVSGQRIAPLEQSSSLTLLATDNNQTRALTAVDQGAVLWNSEDGSRIRKLDTSHIARLFAISPNGRWALLSDTRGSTTALGLTSDGPQWRVNEDAPLIAAAFSPDSRRLFTVSRDGTGRIRRTESGETIVQLSDLPVAQNKDQADARWHSNGRLVSFACDNRCRLHDASTGKPASNWLVHDRLILGTRFSNNGRFLVTASADQTARIWDITTGRQSTPDLRHQWLVFAADFTADSRQVATASWDKAARFWDRATGLPITDPLPHPDWVLALDFHPSGQWLATGCRDGIARVWELPRMSEPVPPWVPELAESLGGYRVRDGEHFESVGDRRQLLALRDRLNEDARDGDGYYVRLGRWFFADRDQRPVSPASTMTMESYLRRLAEADRFRGGFSHEELLRLAPMEPRYLARLAHKLVAHGVWDALPDLERADWVSRLALSRAPDSALGWWARAEVLLALDRAADARAAIDTALRLDPEDATAWLVNAQIQHRSGPPNQAFDAFKQAIRLVRTQTNRSSQAVERYTDPLLRILGDTEFSDTMALRSWIAPSDHTMRTDRFHLLIQWALQCEREDWPHPSASLEKVDASQ